MIQLCYLLDENTNPILRNALLRIEPEMTVWRVGDPCAPQDGTPDPVILEWCAENRFALVTNNRASMPKHIHDHITQGGTAPAVFVLNPRMSLQETISELQLIWGASEPREYENTIRFLPFFR